MNNNGSPNSRNELLAPNRLLAHLHRLLIDSATAQGGTLPIAKLEDLLEAVRQEMASQMTGANSSLNHRLSAYTPALNSRSNYVGRVIVGGFESILRSPHNNRISERALPRQIISPFFRALRMMIGSATLDAAQQQLSSAVQRIKNEEPKLPTERVWQRLNDSPAATEFRIDLFTRLSPCFEQFEHRKDWFIRLINTVLGGRVLAREPTLLEPAPESIEWVFTEIHFFHLINSLSTDTRQLLLHNNDPKMLTQKFEPQSLLSVQYLLSQLDAAR